MSQVSVIEQYWGGVLQRLRAEADIFAKLVQHMGERGRMNELALSRLLCSFVPERIGVGTGVLFDSADRQSPQTDVVLFDRGDQPAAMAQTTQVMFPVEVATACIEIKTTLSSESVRDCLKKRRRLHELTPLIADGVPSGHPPFVVLSYDAGFASPQASIDSFARDQDHLPDLLCILDIGLIAGRPDLLDLDQEAWACGLAFAQQVTGDATWRYVTADPQKEREEINGQLVAVVDHDGGHFAADPGRALLLFADALARLIAQRTGTPAPVISHYLTERVRSLVPLIPPSV